jgi:hypothetical protein
MDVLVDEIPVYIHHLRPRGRDIIHVEVGGTLDDGTEWIPTAEELKSIAERWRSLTKPGENVRVMVTPKYQKATIKPDVSAD